MSFNIEAVRKFYQDPVLQFLRSLSKRIAKQETENVEIETDDLTGFGDSDHSIVRYDDRWNFRKKYTSVSNYIQFDGVNDYINCGTHSDLWNQSLTKLSFSFWVYPTGMFDGADGFRVMVLHDGGSDRIATYFFTTGSKVIWDIRGISASFDATALSLNAWHLITCVYDSTLGSANVKIYVDSVLGSVTGNATGAYNISSTMYLALWGTNDQFKGNMKDFRWWNTALTQTNITNLRNGNDSAVPIPNYWLKMDDGPTNPVDFISKTKTATLQNGAAYPMKIPQLPLEPDFDTFVLDLRYDHLGDWLTDYSGLNGRVEIFGEPCPTSGVNVGFRGGPMKNTAWQVSQSEQIYLKIDDEDEEDEPITYYNMTGLTTGLSFIFRLNFKSLSTSNSVLQTLIEKTDDTDNRYSIRIGSDGNIHGLFELGGTETKRRTNNTPIAINTDVEIGVSFNVTGNVVKFYVNGVEDTSTTSSSESWQTANFTQPYNLCQVPINTDDPTGGFCDLNYIDMTRMYRRVVSSTGFANHYYNKISISDISAGDVFLFDATVFPDNQVLDSFTTTSFTTTSFTAS